MEKESLIHSLQTIDSTFKSFFDFNIIFSPDGKGKVILNHPYIEESSILIANKIAFISSQVEDSKKTKLNIFDISDIIENISNETFNNTNNEEILAVLNQIATKYKYFQEFKSNFSPIQKITAIFSDIR